MLLQDLKKGTTYTNVLDIKVPLLFTGKTVKRNQYGSLDVIVYFKPVTTEANKNWISCYGKTVTKAFSTEAGNDYIKA